MSAWVPEHDKRQSKASAKVTDAANTSKPGLKSHQAARDLADSEATRILTSKSTAVKKTPTGTCPATTTTISQSTTAKRKQPASILDVEDEDSHVKPYICDRPRPRPKPSQAKPKFWLLAWLVILQSPSRQRPGQSGGFQAKTEPAHHYWCLNAPGYC